MGSEDQPPERRVDFFVAGVQKGGTTALDRLLRGHPDIQMARRKEVHFFDTERLNWDDPDPAPLHDCFDWSDGATVRGEATPIYLYWPDSIRRIVRYNPMAKFILCLRHPSFRAYSQWKMEVKRGQETLGFSDAIRGGRDRVAGAPGAVHRVYSYVERGFFAEQLDRMFRHVARENVLFLTAERVWLDTGGEMARICRFLGIAPHVPAARSFVVPIDTSEFPPMAEEDRAYLAELYDPTIRALPELTGLACSHWLDPTYREPMGRDPERTPQSTP